MQWKVCQNIQCLVHVFGKIYSLYYSNWLLPQVSLKTGMLLVNVINRNFNMEDFLKYRSAEENLTALSLPLNYSLGICGFRLTKWLSNSHNF